MALSQESSGVPDSQELERRFRDDALRAKELAAQLTIQHNPEPGRQYREREARNPAHPGTVVIRTLRPQPTRVLVQDIDAVRDHNTFVGSLGTSGTRFGS